MAHAARFRTRRAAQQRPRLAAGRAEGAARGADAARQRQRSDAAGEQPSDDERRRRDDAPLLGAELAVEPVGLQGRQRDDAPVRRLAHPERIDGRGLAVRSRRARAVLRQGGVRDRRVRPGGKHPRPGRSPRQHLRGPALARLPDAAASRHRVHRDDGGGRHRPRLASVPRSGGDQLAIVPGPLGLHVSRVLQQGRLPRRREELAGGDHDPEGAEDRPVAGGHARARDHHRGRPRRPRERRHLRHRWRRVFPARESRPAGELHLREHADAVALEIDRLPERPLEQSRPGRAALLQPQSAGGRHGAVPEESEHLVRPAGARHRHRRLRRRQLRPSRRSTSSAAATSGCSRTAARFRRRQ